MISKNISNKHIVENTISKLNNIFMTMRNKRELSQEERDEILKTLKVRFEKNMNRHKDLEWTKIQTKLEANPEKLWSLYEMEQTGGEPDVIRFNEKTNEYFFL